MVRCPAVSLSTIGKISSSTKCGFGRGRIDRRSYVEFVHLVGKGLQVVDRAVQVLVEIGDIDRRVGGGGFDRAGDGPALRVAEHVQELGLPLPGGMQFLVEHLPDQRRPEMTKSAHPWKASTGRSRNTSGWGQYPGLSTPDCHTNNLWRGALQCFPGTQDCGSAHPPARWCGWYCSRPWTRKTCVS